MARPEVKFDDGIVPVPFLNVSLPYDRLSPALRYITAVLTDVRGQRVCYCRGIRTKRTSRPALIRTRRALHLFAGSLAWRDRLISTNLGGFRGSKGDIGWWAADEL